MEVKILWPLDLSSSLTAKEVGAVAKHSGSSSSEFLFRSPQERDEALKTHGESWRQEGSKQDPHVYSKLPKGREWEKVARILSTPDPKTTSLETAEEWRKLRREGRKAGKYIYESGDEVDPHRAYWFPRDIRINRENAVRAVRVFVTESQTGFEQAKQKDPSDPLIRRARYKARSLARILKGRKEGMIARQAFKADETSLLRWYALRLERELSGANWRASMHSDSK